MKCTSHGVIPMQNIDAVTFTEHTITILNSQTIKLLIISSGADTIKHTAFQETIMLHNKQCDTHHSGLLNYKTTWMLKHSTQE